MNVDPQRQLDTATAFFLAGERCCLELRFKEYGLHTVSAPTVVNYAFSVELGLKLIHFLALGRPATGHDLEKLFRALPDEIRENLSHLSECVVDIARYFEDWRYPFERDFLVGDYENPRRAFIECYREIKRLRPRMRSVYEELWGSFEPEWLQWLVYCRYFDRLVNDMPSFLEQLDKLNLPKVPPPVIPDPVLDLAARIGLTLRLTSPSVPEQYEVTRNGVPVGYIHARRCGMSVHYSDAGDEELYDGPIDGFAGFTDHEREARLLFALGVIAARIMRV